MQNHLFVSRPGGASTAFYSIYPRLTAITATKEKIKFEYEFPFVHDADRPWYGSNDGTDLKKAVIKIWKPFDETGKESDDSLYFHEGTTAATRIFGGIILRRDSKTDGKRIMSSEEKNQLEETMREVGKEKTPNFQCPKPPKLLIFSTSKSGPEYQADAGLSCVTKDIRG